MAEKLNLDDYIRKIPDFPKKGILFYDVTSILTNPRAFQYCVDRMREIYADKKIDAVAAIEARGFIFAAPFAVETHVPLILLRKKGKLPGKTIHRSYELEYGEAAVELHVDDVKKGQRVLLVDDLIATGGTLLAAKELLEEVGAEVPEIFGVMGLPFLNYEKTLTGVPVTTLIEYNHE
ncbi:MAG: adenine phosphoribosyltransferase [Spirochaetaceae bacterium]|jgi:adenine phosphoribosyltransferase|nr:adenine phosphoribosyltransferase [Spirochaetaceae bacterium]